MTLRPGHAGAQLSFQRAGPSVDPSHRHTTSLAAGPDDIRGRGTPSVTEVSRRSDARVTGGLRTHPPREDNAATEGSKTAQRHPPTPPGRLDRDRWRSPRCALRTP